MSDLHLEFAGYKFTEREDVDLYINAGDITTADRPIQRINYLASYKKLFFVNGNHDFYGGHFENEPGKIVEVNGVKIAGATLWTDLSNPLNWLNYSNGLNDSRCIMGLYQDKYIEAHNEQKSFLFNSGADVFVSHHAPSYLSCGEQYKGDPLNSGFMSELSNELLSLPKPPKLWIHGHVHGEFDYMIGETRIICWPRGYPGENPWFQDYLPKIVEV